MKSIIVSVLLVGLIHAGASLAQAQPTQSFGELLLRNETDPSSALEGKKLATQLHLPLRVTLPSGVLIEVMGVEAGRPVYGVITNFAHPEDGSRLAFFESIEREHDLSRARILYDSRPGPSSSRAGTGRASKHLNLTQVLLVPDWTADRIMAFNPGNGDLVDSTFIPTTSPALQSPKQARLSPRNTITVSDQISDLVQDFTTSGTYMGWFAPAGGVNNAILDNIRGHNYRSNGHLLVCVASGTNSNSIAEFDSAGNYIGNFIAIGAGGLNGPFDILFRTSDMLISQSSSPIGVKQYDLNGTYIGQWTTISSFPQQIFQLSDGRVAVANFSGAGSTGIRLYAADGTFIRLLSGVTGNRGVCLLGNGNFITTNASGIHEIDSTSGALIRTIYTGTNLQYIDLVDVPSGLPIFTVNPVAVGFDSVTLGSSKLDSVIVRNPGAANLTITSITASDPRFSVTPASAVLAPSESLTVRILFTPDSARVRTGTVAFVHNAAGSPSTVNVTGVGRLFTVSVNYATGWNLVSLPVIPENDSVRVVLPMIATPYAFSFEPGSGYQSTYILFRGRGHWAKFPGPTVVTYAGYPIFLDSIAVVPGWNLIGSISCPVDTLAIFSSPPGIRASNWFGYSSGYVIDPVIRPGKAYWVKANAPGWFILQCAAARD